MHEKKNNKLQLKWESPNERNSALDNQFMIFASQFVRIGSWFFFSTLHRSLDKYFSVWTRIVVYFILQI